MSKLLDIDEGKAAAQADAPDAQELARRLQAGDEGAFDELVRLFETRIFNLAYRMVGNREDASEVTQDVFIKVHRAIKGFKGTSSFSTWLYAVASNTCRNRMRVNRRLSIFESRSPLEADGYEEGAQQLGDVDAGPDPNMAAQRGEINRLVQKALGGLPDAFRMVAVMRDVQGMKYEEIAAAMRCSSGTVKSRLARARGALREKLELMGVHVGSVS